MPDSNVVITRTITTANSNESFIKGIHLKTTAKMLKIFELVTRNLSLARQIMKPNTKLTLFEFLLQILAAVAIYAIAVYIHDYGRLSLVEVHWKPRNQNHEIIQYSRPLDGLDLFILMTPIICFICLLCLLLFSIFSRNQKLIAQNVRVF